MQQTKILPAKKLFLIEPLLNLRIIMSNSPTQVIVKRNMLKRLINLLAIIIGLTVSASAQNVQKGCNKLLEPSIGLSYCVPANWKIVKHADETYQKIFGETYNQLTPVMGINIIVDKDPLSTVVATRIDGLYRNYKSKPMIASVKLESKNKFNVGSLQGYKVVFSTSSTKGFDARAIFYFFKGKDKSNIILSALIPLPMTGDTEKVIDNAVKTLKIEN
jgi:hypothetical protein